MDLAAPASPASPFEPTPEERPYPVFPRVFAGILALVGGLYYGAALPGNLVGRGFPYSAAAMAATVAPFVVLFILLALAPRTLEPLAKRFTRLDLKDGAHMGAALVMAVTLWMTLGNFALAGGVYTFESQILRDEPAQELSTDALLAGLVVNAFVFILPPLLYVGLVRDPNARSPWDALGLRWEGLPRALGIGAASAFGVILLIAVIGAAATVLGVEPDENERALEIAQGAKLGGSLILGALAVAVGSSITEEIFFRGFLQPRIGLFAQAAIFSLAHLSYLNVMEVVVTFTLALVFGILYRRTGNLWAPIAGHFTFNLVMLLLAQSLEQVTPAFAPILP